MLELRLRQNSGNQFQDFFSTAMAVAHGDDFVRIRPHGKLGDKGCDGYLNSTGEVFACFGTVNGRTPPIAELLRKLRDDVDKSRKHLTTIMKSWTFVHNFVDGVPIDAIRTLKQVEKDVLKIPVTQFGPARFAKLVMALPDATLNMLLGPALTEEDVSNLDYRELRAVVDAIANDGLKSAADLQSVSPVSSEKLDFNSLSETWRTLLLAGLRNARNVERYFTDNPDPLLGTRAADVIRTKFLDLELQKLSADEILTQLYASILGTVNARPERQTVGLALIGYMFETCTLLRDAPAAVRP